MPTSASRVEQTSGLPAQAVGKDASPVAGRISPFPRRSVTATFLLIPTIGAAVTVALTVTGQQLASALIDQFGLFRMPRRPLTTPRVGGLTLLIAGSVLVQLS